MASTPSIFLQEPSFKWKNHSHHSPQLPTQNPFAHNHVKIHKNLKKLSINCLFTNDNPAPDRRISKIGFQKLEIKQNPVEIVAETVGNMLKALRRPAAAAAAAVVVGLLLMYDPNSALAASGGRMGGRLFSSSSLSQSSAPYHVKIHKKSKKLKQNPVEIMAGNMVKSEKLKQNPVEIMAGNMVKSLGKTAAAAVVEGLLYMCDPNSELAASGGGDGREVVCAVAELQHPADGGRVQAVSQSSAPSQSYSMPPMEAGSGFSFSVPYHAPSPFDEVHVDPTVVVASIFSLSMILFVALVSMPSFLYDGSKGSVLTATDKTSVLKLQVGLLGLGRSLQKDLNRIAEIADTSTSTGLHYVLTETVLALLRHPDYCISGYSSVDVKRSMEEGEKKFNQLSIEERGKFDEETLVNVNNIKKQSSTILRASGFSNEYIVITILVAAEGDHKLPPINNSKDLKDALQKLAAIPSSRTMAVEVLWTPQNEDDTLSERELLEDYPLLRPL